MVRKLATLLPLVGLLVTGNANALGLGEIKLDSALNQPLRAEIELLDERGLASGEVLPSLAGIEDFKRASVERMFFLSNIQFQILEKEDGLYIELTTRQPVQEPFLNFLVEVNWPAGRLLREYTVLLDPPVYEDTVTIENEIFEPVIQQEEVPAAQPTELTSQAQVSVITEKAEPKPVRDDTLPEGQYRVQRNDTMWEIAAKFRKDPSVTPQQMMLAIQQENPKAFIRGNINRLKAGSVLTIPNVTSAKEIELSDAVKEINRQNKALAQPSDVETQVPVSASGSAASSLDDGSERNPDGHLELVSAEKEAEITAGAGGDVSERMTSLENDLVVALELNDELSREREELLSRVTQLEEQIEIMQRMISLQNETAAALQEMDQITPEVGDASAGVDGSSIEGVEDVESTQEQDSLNAGVQEPLPGTVSEPEVQQSEPVAPPQPEPAPVEPPKPEPVKPVTPTPAPVPTPTPVYQSKPIPLQILDDVIAWVSSSLTNMLIVGFGGLLLLGLLGYSINKRRSGDDEEVEDESLVEEAYDQDDEEDSHNDPDLDDYNDVDLEEDLAAEDPSEAAEAENTDAIAEADIYIAYGRYDQAEDILKAALEQDSSRDDYRVKLAEVYAESGNAAGFAQMEQQLKGSGPIAENRIADLKSQANFADGLATQVADLPEASAPAESAIEQSTSDLDFSLDQTSEESVPVLDIEDSGDDIGSGNELSDLDLSLDDGLDLSSDSSSDGLDFELDIDVSGLDNDLSELGLDGQADEVDSGVEALDFSLELETEESPETTSALETNLDSDIADEVGDLEFSLDEDVSSEPSIASEPTETGSFEVSDLSLDFEETPIEIEEDVELSVEDELPASDIQASLNETSIPELGADDLGDLEMPELDADVANEVDPLAALDAQIEALEASSMEDEASDNSHNEALGDLGSLDLSDVEVELSDLDSADFSVEDLNLQGSDDKISESEELPQRTADVIDLGLGQDEGLQIDPSKLADLDDDLDISDLDDDFDFLAGSDETSTKLDLARAYIDMDDKDGARDILEEVVQEGNDEQKQKAQDLLKQIA